MTCGRMRRLWRWLTEPSPALKEPERRRQAQLLTSLIILLVPLGFFVAAIPDTLNPDATVWTDPEVQIMLVVGVFMTICYGLSRTKYYMLTAVLGVMVSSLAIFLAAVPDDSPIDYIAFFYLVIPILLAGLFLSIGSAVIVAAANIVGMFLFPLLVPQTSLYDLIMGPLSFILLSSLAMLLAAYYRGCLERDRQAQLRYQADLLQSVSDAVIATDLEFKVTSWNKGAEKIYGWRAQEVLGRSLGDFTQTRHYDHWRAEVLARLLSDGYWEGQLTQRRKDGTTVQVWTPISLVRDCHGNPTGAVAVNRDITARQAAEEVLARRNQELRALYETALEINTQPDTYRLLSAALRRAANLLNVSRGGLFLLRPEGDALELVAAHNLGEKPIGNLYSLSEGFPGCVLQRARPLLIIDDGRREACLEPAIGGPMGRLLGVSLKQGERAIGVLAVFDDKRDKFRDGSVRLLNLFATQATIALENARLNKRAQQEQSERERAEKALQRSEVYFRSLIENARDAVIVIDAEGHILYGSPSVERVLGYNPADLIGRNLFERIHVEDMTRLIEAFTPSTDIVGLSSMFEARIRHQDGAWRIIELVGNNLLHDPIMSGIVLNLRDITERKHLEEQLHQSRKMEAIGRLAGGIAHDFNNILTVITGYSDLLLHRLDGRDPRYKLVNEIFKSAERAAALTRQLLAFSRKQILHLRLINLNEAITEMEAMLRSLIGEDIDLITDLAPDLKTVKADLSQIEQVIMNLVINARDAMPQGGELIIKTANVDLDTIYTRYHASLRPGPYVLLAISDTGHGMDVETQARVFEPFFTTKEKGKGTGLGLATIYGIIQQSDGHIEVESEPGWGTRFNVYLPYIEEATEVKEITIARVELTPGSETILLVEDEPGVRELLHSVLAGQGYTVLTARSGLAALQLSQEHPGPIHLLVTDVVMPGGMSGRELAKQLTASRPDIKVLYISGYTDDALGQRGVVDPGLILLQKPFTANTLIHKVREVLDRP